MSENRETRGRTTRQIVAEIMRINEQMADGSRKLDELYDELDRRDERLSPRVIGSVKGEQLEDGTMLAHIKTAHTVLHDHAAVQHRDGKEPWCNVCFKTEDGRDPVSKIGIYPPGYKGDSDE